MSTPEPSSEPQPTDRPTKAEEKAKEEAGSSDGSPDLVYSVKADRSDPSPLDEATIKSVAYVFIHPADTNSPSPPVEYLLDDSIESTAETPPYDFAGGDPSAARPFSFTAGDHKLVAGELTADFSVSEVEAPDPAGNWLTWGLGGLLLVVVGYWALILSLPAEGPPIADWALWAIGIAGVLLIIAAIVLAVVDKAGAAFVAAVGGVGGLVVAGLGSQGLSLDDGTRLALGVGGLAVGALVVGISRFSTIRAGAAVPLLVIFIGAATWPAAEDILASDIRQAVILWTGVVLGVSGLTEGVKQVAKVIAEGRVNSAAMSGGLGGLEGLRTAVVSEGPHGEPSQVEFRPVVLAEPEGDFQRSS